MECGLPCISFNIPSSREIISDNIDGILVESYDINQFAEKLSILIENQELRIKYGKNAKQNVQRYNIDTILEKWSNVFKEII